MHGHNPTTLHSLSDADLEDVGRMIEDLQPPQYTSEEILAKFSILIHRRLMAGVRMKDIMQVMAAKGFKVTRKQVESAAADAAARKLATKGRTKKPVPPTVHLDNPPQPDTPPD